MTDNINTADLVKRLRDEHVAASRTEAADRIEQLEAALTRANAATAARIAELEGANGVHIPRAPSKQEMVEVEKMAADGKFQEAAQKFGGRVTYGGPAVNAIRLEAAIREAIRLGSQPHYGDEDAALFHYSEAMDVLRAVIK